MVLYIIELVLVQNIAEILFAGRQAIINQSINLILTKLHAFQTLVIEI
jgi:hypothetical protein